MSICSINPATGTTERTFDPLSDDQIDRALARAAAAYHEWRKVPIDQRAALMCAAADLLEREVNTSAQLITVEMGKPIAASRGEVLKSASTMRFYANRAADFTNMHMKALRRLNNPALILIGYMRNHLYRLAKINTVPFIGKDL